MPDRALEILYEDNHLLAINKPAGLPTMGVEAGLPSAIGLAREYIKRRYHKPGNVYLGVVSRLDASTTGVLLFARTSKAAARLSEQFRRGAVAKTYWAIVEGALKPAEGELVDWLIKDESRRKMVLADRHARGAQEARLRYRTLRSLERGTLLEVDLLTGRKHQIRVQLAHRGAIIAGEQKYGKGLPFGPGIALHSRRLVVEHPVRKDAIEIAAPLPRSWAAWGVTDGESAPSNPPS